MPYPSILVVAGIPTITTGNPGNKKKSGHAPKFSDNLTFAFFFPFLSTNVTLYLKITGLNIFGRVIFLKVSYIC